MGCCHPAARRWRRKTRATARAQAQGRRLSARWPVYRKRKPGTHVTPCVIGFQIRPLRSSHYLKGPRRRRNSRLSSEVVTSFTDLRGPATTWYGSARLDTCRAAGCSFFCSAAARTPMTRNGPFSVQTQPRIPQGVDTPTTPQIRWTEVRVSIFPDAETTASRD